MPIETFILFLFTTAVVVFSPGAAAIAVASQGATNGGKRALAGMCGVAFVFAGLKARLFAGEL